jgi:hypothetical protein
MNLVTKALPSLEQRLALAKTRLPLSTRFGNLQRGVLSIEFAPRRILARVPGSDRHTGHGPKRAG